MKVQVLSEVIGNVVCEFRQDIAVEHGRRRAIFMRDGEEAVREALKAAVASVLAGDTESTFKVKVFR